ncbi:MAG: hypothetical protein ISS34_02990 [Candidatus Omnitrophica bacterium]|nr:hypothetical protein [Candidatus Omnitrophota bacterium]
MATNSIIVHTRQGNEINNYQGESISLWERSLIKDTIRKYKPILRSLSSPIYNCHGMTFASRRTAIDDSQEIHKILKEDEYKEVPSQKVLAGDIILYFNDGDIEHSGIVILRPKPPLYIPQVYSKWGNGFEAVHYANNCPYNYQVKYYRVYK